MAELSVIRLDTMENWDEKKLEEVVNKKHGEAEKKKAKTQIVSCHDKKEISG